MGQCQKRQTHDTRVLVKPTGNFLSGGGDSGFDRLQVCKYHRTIAKSGDFPHQPQQIVDVLQNMNGKQIVIGS
jgi:hypothetical protein